MELIVLQFVGLAGSLLCVNLAVRLAWRREMLRRSCSLHPLVSFFQFECHLHLPKGPSIHCSRINPFCRKEVRWKGSGKPECTQQLLRIIYCLLHSRLKDHGRVTVFACYYGLCPILAPCTSKDNDGDTTCLFSYMFSSPRTFQWSEHQNLRSRHWWANMMIFLPCGSWSVKGWRALPSSHISL